MSWRSAAAIFIFFNTCFVSCYKPVVIVHGVLDFKGSLDVLGNHITEQHPGTNVTIIDLLHGWRSLSPMWYQVQEFGVILRQVMAENPGGIHVIGYSQGGLVARGMIQSMDDHVVKTFVSLSSPQAGQYGDDFLHLFFPTFFKQTVYRIFYSGFGQYTAIANYWNDPHHQDLYFEYSDYLAAINNEKPSNSSANYKKNMMKLERLVMIGGPDDGVITPWQSSHFAFYNDNETVVDMRDRDLYAKDLFGLKSMDKKKKLTFYEVPGVQHLEWHDNVAVINKCILPWLD